MHKFKTERVKKLSINIVLYTLLGFAYYIFIKLTGLRIPCISHALFHFHCPGCGVTRMCVALIEGNIPLAFRQNALVLCFLPIFAIWGIYKAYKYAVDEKPGFAKLEKICIIIMFVAAVVFAVLRNIPAYDFLAPIPW